MLDRGDREAGGLEDRIGGVARLRLAVEVEAVELLAVEMRQPRRETSPASVWNSTSTVQYSRGLNASISASRSQIRRSATDCTRPAERLPGNLRHSTGDSVNPTR